MSRGSIHARIASLYRELAEAHEQLAAEDTPARRPGPKRTQPERAPADPEMVVRVRRSLRRQGVAI
ncbi:MAG TPA: hypothetical protein VFV10_15890 [Gammaproteobacteria bacterium]|nr:hypothetical protein [Gammaproteobacteria bacterium]